MLLAPFQERCTVVETTHHVLVQCGKLDDTCTHELTEEASKLCTGAKTTRQPMEAILAHLFNLFCGNVDVWPVSAATSQYYLGVVPPFSHLLQFQDRSLQGSSLIQHLGQAYHNHSVRLASRLVQAIPVATLGVLP